MANGGGLDTLTGSSGWGGSDAELQAWHSVVDGGWALFARISAEFSANGMSITDLRVLEVLPRRPYFSISELAATVHMGVSTVSRLVSRLIDSGDVARIPSPSDGRHRLVCLTDHGYDTLECHVALRNKLVRKLVAEVLTPEEFETLGVAFTKIREVGS